MAQTIVGLYDRFEDAQAVVQHLVNEGISRESINLLANDTRTGYGKNLQSEGSMGDATAKGAGTGAVIGGIGGLLVGLGALMIPGIGPVLAAGPILGALGGAGLGAAAGGIVGALVDAGIPDEQANAYAEGVRRGGTLVMVQTGKEHAQHVIDIMNMHNPVDINRRSSSWQQNQQWSGFDQTSQPYDRSQLDEINIPVIEEELQVGKREVDAGGVRVNTFVTEQDVQENIRLREERVNVDRRPADRTADPSEIGAFQEGTMELRETREEPIVRKEARVVEDVTVRKDVQERDETIRDTVRRQDVNVEQMGQERTTGQRMDFDNYETNFRQHYDSRFANSSYGYSDFRRAYRYGFDASGNSRYQNRNWDEIEMDLRRDWEQNYRDTPWDDFRDAVRVGWESLRSGGRR